MSLKQEINLFTALQANKFGGVPVFIAHLCMSLEQMGYAPRIIRIAKKDHLSPKEFTHGQQVLYMSLESCKALAETAPSILCTPTSSGVSKEKFDPSIALFCEDYDVPVIIHDIAEFYPDVLERAKQGRIRVLCIRERVREQLKALGVEATFMPHPYVSFTGYATDLTSRWRGVGATRVDFRKKTAILVEANKLQRVADGPRVQLYGALNRMYAHHVLDKVDRDWRVNYHGDFEPTAWAAVLLYSRHQLAFDLTVIKGDGDGTQYSFLEAIDAGCVLVLHKEWIRTGKGEMRPGVNCLTVETPEEVATLLTSQKQYEEISERASHVLDVHSPEVVVPHYEEILKL